VGSAAAIGAAIGTGGAAATFLLANGWESALVCTAIIAAARIAKPFVFTRIAESIYNADSGPTDIAAPIEEASKEMSRRAGIPAPIVSYSKRVKNFGMIDGTGGKNVLLYNDDFARELSSKETTALVAHEIAHADRLSGKLRLIVSGASGVTSLSTFIGSIAYCAGSGFGLLSSGALVIGASIVSGGMMGTLSNVFSRATELRTDIRAVELTGDLGGYLGTLKTVYQLTNRGVPKWIQAMQPFSTHPRFETREWWIRHACGNPRHDAK
jgi:Zn-dependent protease with chaperone function